MVMNSKQEWNLFDLYASTGRLYYITNVKKYKLWEIGNEREKCRRFIGDCFEKGKKRTLFDFDFQEAYLENGKHLHTVSLYLLGAAFIERNSTIRDNLKGQLETFLPQYDKWYTAKDVGGGYEFLYTWYLTALYHDVASCIENIRVPENPTERQKSLEYYLGELDIAYSPYGDFPYRKLNIPQRFSENLIRNYFYYRADKGFCEHGILAGYLFFDRFIKNFLGHCQNKTLEEDGSIALKEYLKWNVEQLSHAAYVADAIICHNIWMGGERETGMYQAYGLSPLLYMKHSENKLSIKKYPLQFMLCLLDTIEPIKRFAKVSFEEPLYPKDVLENIKLKFEKTKLQVDWKEDIRRQPEFEYWKNALKDLQNWMEVQCEVDDTRAAISWSGN